jgi:hypothetical protein
VFHPVKIFLKNSVEYLISFATFAHSQKGSVAREEKAKVTENLVV